jgi:hypothetical protein
VAFLVFGFKEHKSFESFSGSIGITLSGKYVEFHLFKASLSRLECSFTYSETSAIETINLYPPCSPFNKGGV